MVDTKLAGKVVLITGGNSGIGAEMALAFARQGAAVMVHYLETGTPASREPPGHKFEHAILGRPAAERVLAEIERLGAKAAMVSGDLADATVVPRLFDRSEEALGPVEVLVNNAAHDEVPDTLKGITPGVIDRHFAVNARASVLMAAEFARRLRHRGFHRGRVVNISTDAAQAFAGQIAYGASKAALEAFTRSLAMELGPAGITVNAVAPGPIQTGYITPEMEEALLPLIPLRRLGEPSDIADVVVFIASDQARWLTGQVIRVCGGHIL